MTSANVRLSCLLSDKDDRTGGPVSQLLTKKLTLWDEKEPLGSNERWL